MGTQPEGQMSKHLTGEPKGCGRIKQRTWRIERCHGCNRLVYACRSELDKNGKHYHRECFPQTKEVQEKMAKIDARIDGLFQGIAERAKIRALYKPVHIPG